MPLPCDLPNMRRPELRDGPGAVFNITARVNWAVWHLDPETNARIFLAILDRCAKEFGFSLIGYVLMANHYHVLAQSPPDPRYTVLTTRRTGCRHRRPFPPGHLKASALRQLMHQLMWRTSIRIQRELGVKGHFWEESYWPTRIEDVEHLLVALVYDHLNPVTNHIVDRPEDYRRSSAAWWAGCGRADVELLARPLPLGLDLERFRASLLRVQENSGVLQRLKAIDNGELKLDSHDGRQNLRRKLQHFGLAPSADLRIRNPHLEAASD